MSEEPSFAYKEFNLLTHVTLKYLPILSNFRCSMDILSLFVIILFGTAVEWVEDSELLYYTEEVEDKVADNRLEKIRECV